MANIAQYLEAASSLVDAVRNEAERELRAFESSQPEQYLLSLSSALRSDTLAAHLRQLAGIALKNAVHAEDESLRDIKARRWRAVSQPVRAQIKSDTLATLTSVEQQAQSAAAQAIACIAGLDVPVGQWPELVATLVNVSADAATAVTTRAATITALGYVCDELPIEALRPDEVDSIMRLLVVAMGDDQPPEVRRGATAALHRSLDFATAYFDDKNAASRAVLMDSILKRVQDSDERTRRYAYECINRVAELFYDNLDAHIDQLAALTFATAQGADENLAISAVEFWAVIAETEADYADDEETAAKNKNYAGRVGSVLVPILLELMCRVTEDADDSTYTVSQAAANAFESMSKCLGDGVLDMALEFIRPNLLNGDWRRRDAAALAIGLCMDGASEARLRDLIKLALPQLLGRLIRSQGTQEPSVAVRDSLAWVIGHIFETRSSLVEVGLIPTAVAALLEALDDEPRVAQNVAYALNFMAGQLEEDEAGNSRLQPFFLTIVDKMLARADKEDWDENQLRDACYECIMTLIEITGDSPAEIEALLAVLRNSMERLRVALTRPMANADDKADAESSQINVTAVIQTIVERLTAAQLKPFARSLVELLLHTIDLPTALSQEEAYRAMGVVADCLGEEFSDVLPLIMPRIARSMQNLEAAGVCGAAMQCAGDIARRVGVSVAPYINDLAVNLLQGLSNIQMARSVRPLALAVLGDVSTALGQHVLAYLQHFMPVIQSAALTKVPTANGDPDMIEYKNSLRRSVLEAWTAIVQEFLPSVNASLQEKQAVRAGNVAKIGSYVAEIIAVLKTYLEEEVRNWAEDEEVNEKVLHMSVALLSDIGDAIGKEALASTVNQAMPWVHDALKLSDQLERGSWGGETRDESGKLKKTAADLAKKNLP